MNPNIEPNLNITAPTKFFAIEYIRTIADDERLIVSGAGEAIADIRSRYSDTELLDGMTVGDVVTGAVSIMYDQIGRDTLHISVNPNFDDPIVKGDDQLRRMRYISDNVREWDAQVRSWCKDRVLA